MTNLNWIVLKNAITLHTRSLLGATVFLICGIAFTLVGALEEEMFLAIGLPILSIGLLATGLVIISIRIAFTQPHNTPTFSWWLHFVSGFSGAFLFSIPSMLVLPILLIIGDDNIVLGGLFSVIGAILTIVFTIVAIRMYRRRPRWTRSI